MFCSVNAIYCTIRLSKHYISNCLLIIDIYCLFFGTIKLPLCTCGFIFSVYKIIRGSLKKLIFHFVEINAVNIKIQFDNIQNHIVITNNNNCKRLILFFNNFWTVCIATWNLNMDILNCLLKSQSGVQMTYNKQLIFCLSVQ